MNLKCLIETFVFCVQAYPLERGFPKNASASEGFDSKRHFTAGIWWTKLLEILQENIKGELSSPDTNFDDLWFVSLGQFLVWLVCKWCKAICCVAVERKAGGRRLLVVTVVASAKQLLWRQMGIVLV
ncbi:hypothetical protein RchiOBHm_Chr1g0349601 [Rosa chinensis]|uniref:Uncharacterized protein n=1 Tax=Rosa chinensis TaxID=74649 RepID=A0A2P6SFV3_ROSCH|nr:hypothetical protein RchiOBHm_Chr1g0349601 [Rosa chinensis]